MNRTSSVLAHPVVRRLACRFGIAEEVGVWEWLLDNVRTGRFHVPGTDVSGDGFGRELEVEFVSDLDARRFADWARGRGYVILERERDA